MRACGWCRRPFFICRSCDRGHVYCGERCRREGYARHRQAARARHQRSPEGRLDHRDRQRAYRARRRSRVTDQSSRPAGSSGKEARSPATSSRLAKKESADGESPKEPGKLGRCAICGQRRRWVRYDAWWMRAAARARWPSSR